jgi:hypothetical protein
LPIVWKHFARVDNIDFFRPKGIYVTNDGADVTRIFWLFERNDEVFAAKVSDLISSLSCWPFLVCYMLFGHADPPPFGVFHTSDVTMRQLPLPFSP